MAELYFNGYTDFEKVARLREEISRLKAELISTNKEHSPEKAVKLEEKLGLSVRQLNDLSLQAAKAGEEFRINFNKSMLERSNRITELSQQIHLQQTQVEAAQNRVSSLVPEVENTATDPQSNKELLQAQESLRQEQNSLFNLQKEQVEEALAAQQMAEQYDQYQSTGISVITADTAAHSLYSALGGKDSLKQLLIDIKSVKSELGKPAPLKSIYDWLGGKDAVKQLITDIVRIRSEFEQTQQRFKVLLGDGNKAKTLLNEIQHYSFDNTFSLGELTEQTALLLQAGEEMGNIIPTLDQLSNVAVGTQTPLGEIVRLYTDMKAQDGLLMNDIQEWQSIGIPVISGLASMFGVTEEKITGMVNAGSIGFQEMNDLLVTLTTNGGAFDGAMAGNMDSLGNSVETLRKSLSSMFNELGELSEDYLKGGLNAASSLIEHYELIGKVLISLAGTYGTYQATTMAVTQLELLRRNNLTILQAATDLLKTKTQALTASMNVNPYVAILTVATALAGTLWSLSESTGFFSDANKKVAEATREFNQEAVAEQTAIRTLFNRLQNATEGTKEYEKVKDSIQKKYGQYLEGLDEETRSLKNVEEAYKAISTAALQSAKDRAMEKATGEAAQRYAEQWVKNIEEIRKRLIKEFGKTEGESLFGSLRDSLENNTDYSAEVEKALRAFDNIQYSQATGTNVNHNFITNLIKNIRIGREQYEIEIDKFNSIFGTVAQNLEGNGLTDPLETSNAKEEIESLKTKIRELNQEIEDYREGIKNAKPGETVAAVIKEKKDELEQAQRTLELLIGKTTPVTGNSSQQASGPDINEKILANQKALEKERADLLLKGKDKEVRTAHETYLAKKAAIDKEREEYRKLAEEKNIPVDQQVLNNFDAREKVAEDQQTADIMKANEKHLLDLAKMENEVNTRFRTNLQNKLANLNVYYTEQVNKAREAGVEEDSDFMQRLQERKAQMQDLLAKDDTLAQLKENEQLELAAANNKYGDTYFQEEAEQKKTEIMLRYAKERLEILKTMEDEASQQEAARLEKTVAGYEKTLAKPSKKSIKNLVDEKAILALQKRFEELGMEEDKAREKAENYANSFTNGMKMASEVSSTLKSAFGGMSEELDMGLDAVTGIAEGFANGGIVGGITSAASSVIGVVGKLFGAKKEIDKSMVEGYETYMGALNKLIDAQVKLLDKLGGAAFGANIRKTTEDLAKGVKATRNLYLESLKAGRSGNSRSDGYKATKMLKGYTKELREVGIYHTDMSKMTDAQIASLRNLPEVYAKLPEGIRKYVDAMGEALDKTEEFNKQLQDTILEFEFTSIADMIVSSITDPSIENALEELEKNIDQTLGNIVASVLKRQLLMEPLENMVNNLYQQMAKTDANGNTTYELTERSAKQFKEGVMNLGKQYKEAWEVMEESFGNSGINLSGKTTEEEETEESPPGENSLSGAYAKASQESIDLLAGQTGAQRVAIEDIRTQVDFIRDLQIKGWSEVTMIRELNAQIASNTNEIAIHTGKIEEISQTISSNAGKTAKSLDALQNHGIKINGL